MLRDQQHVVLEQRAAYALAATGSVAFPKRGQDGDDSEHATHDVVHRRAGAQRTPAGAGHVGQTTHHLHDLIQGRAVLVGTRQETIERTVDDVRAQLAHGIVIEAETLHGAGAKVFRDHVGTGQQTLHDVPPARRLDVHREASLVAIEGDEESGAGACQVTRVVAGDRLHLDHVCAEVRQDHAAARPHDHVHELDHPHARQRQTRPAVTSRRRHRNMS